LIAKGIVPGDNALLLVHEPKSGPMLFSDLKEFHGYSGARESFDLQLAPGVSLQGRVSDNVPRPIEGARVLVHAFPLPQTRRFQSKIAWETETDLNPDGTFSFPSLPRGKAEVIVVMDDWVIENPIKERGHSMRYPHVISTQGAEDQQPVECVISMIPAATAKVHVADQAGNPVEGVTVLFWPNMRWDDWSSQILGAEQSQSEEVKTKTTYEMLSSRSWEKKRRIALEPFSAITDDQGVVVIPNLPPAEKVSFGVKHDSWELPITEGRPLLRMAFMSLKSGVTTQTNVTVIPKKVERDARVSSVPITKDSTP
jgi:hypothetical protein